MHVLPYIIHRPLKVTWSSPHIFMIPYFGYVPCLIQLWIPLMWVRVCYFIQCIHLCFCILKWSWVIFLSLLKHMNINVFILLLMFHWFIIIYKCRLIHKLGLYTSSNILPLASHRLWTWNFLWLIKYYWSPYFVLISMTLNHQLWIRSILHVFIQMSN